MSGVIRVLNREQARSFEDRDEQKTECEANSESNAREHQALWSDRFRRQVRGVDNFDSFTLLLRGCFLVQRDLLLLQQELVERSFLGLIVAVDSTELYFDSGNVVDSSDEAVDILFVLG